MQSAPMGPGKWVTNRKTNLMYLYELQARARPPHKHLNDEMLRNKHELLRSSTVRVFHEQLQLITETFPTD